MLNTDSTRGLLLWFLSIAVFFHLSSGSPASNNDTQTSSADNSSTLFLDGSGNALIPIPIRGSSNGATINIGGRATQSIFKEAEVLQTLDRGLDDVTGHASMGPKGKEQPVEDALEYRSRRFTLYVLPVKARAQGLTYKLAADALDVFRIFIIARQEWGPRNSFVILKGQTVGSIAINNGFASPSDVAAKALAGLPAS